MPTLHIWETNFKEYTVEVAAGSTYTYIPESHAGFHIESVKLGNTVISAPYTFVMPNSYSDLTVFWALDTPPPPPPPPPPPGPESTGYCTIESYQSGFGTLFRYRHPSGGLLGDGYTSDAKAAYHASINSQCFVAPTPAPVPVTQADIAAVQAANTLAIHTAGAMLLNIIGSTATTVFEAGSTFTRSLVDGLGAELRSVDAMLLGGLGTVQKQISDLLTAGIPNIWSELEGIVERSYDEAKAWRAEVVGIWQKLDAWLVERLVGLMLRALDREVEAKK